MYMTKLSEDLLKSPLLSVVVLSGVTVDPYKEKLPASEPMKEQSKEPFQLVKDSLIQYLAEPTI